VEKEMDIFIEAAEQLQALKETLSEQQGSSIRLRGLAEILEQVATQISKIPDGLSLVLDKAESVEQRVLAASNKVEALKEGIPAIVERIERSDVGKSVDALTNDIAGSRSDLAAFRESMTKIDDLVKQFHGINEAFEVNATALKGAGDRQSTALEGFQSQLDAIKGQELAEIRSEIKALSDHILKQDAVLEALRNKRGFLF
jgi:DNA repair ATPase RecN